MSDLRERLADMLDREDEDEDDDDAIVDAVRSLLLEREALQAALASFVRAARGQ